MNNYDFHQFNKFDVKLSNTFSILTKSRGWNKAFDYTLNPYIGCSYGCRYCYVPQIGVYGPHRNEFGEWGKYVFIKTRAIDFITRNAHRLAGKTIYMSSVTDPYQPVEHKALITRGILKELAKLNVHLTVQTRSTMITRDIDLLKDLNAHVFFSLTTDSPDIKHNFERFCPGFSARLKAVKTLTKAGITVASTCCPLLPLRDTKYFADSIKNAGISWVTIQELHYRKCGGVTPKNVLMEFYKLGWTHETYKKAFYALVEYFSPLPVYEACEGYKPFLPHFFKGNKERKEVKINHEISNLTYNHC